MSTATHSVVYYTVVAFCRVGCTLSGLALLFYGLRLLHPGLAYACAGLLLLAIGARAHD